MDCPEASGHPRVLSNRFLFDRFRDTSTIEGRGLGERISHPTPVAAVPFSWRGRAGGARAAGGCLPLIRLVIVRGPSVSRPGGPFVASRALLRRVTGVMALRATLDPRRPGVPRSPGRLPVQGAP